jgi:hypothetical protein
MSTKVPDPDQPSVGRALIGPVARRLMESYVILPVVELEQQVRDHFADQFSTFDLLPNQETKKPRLVWENELDWVKANWTQSGRTIKVHFRNQRCLVWMPKVIGSITEGESGNLVYRHDVVRTILDLLKTVEPTE